MKKNLVKIYQRGRRFLVKHNIRPLFIRRLNSRIIRLLKSREIMLDGHKIYLDQEDTLRLSTRGHSELFIRKLMEENIKEGDVVLDVGAHIGYHSLLMAKLVGKEGKVYSFEAHPETFKILQKNIMANNYSNVVCEHKAVSDKKEKIKFYPGINCDQSSIIHSKELSKGEIFVDAISLDEYLDQGTKIDFIKMDIEGAEFLALRGMRDLLRENKLTMIVELNPEKLKLLKVTLEEFVDFFVKNDFSIKHINETENKLEPFDIEKIHLYIKQRGGTVTYLFCTNY